MLKALLIDDEPAVLDVLSTLLERDGFSVLTASSAAEGSAVLAQKQVDIVVTDLRKEPPLAGFEVVRAARRIVPPPPVPTSDWRSAGADALVVKGVKPGQLPKYLKEFLIHGAAS